MNVAIAPPVLHCPNPNCLHGNTLDREYCEACETRLVRRYLRVVGPLAKPPQTGQLLGNRYQWVGADHDRIVLDTQPGNLPALTEELPDALLPYLRLLPQRLAVPQIYGFVHFDDTQLFLLEDVPVYAHRIAGRAAPKDSSANTVGSNPANSETPHSAVTTATTSDTHTPDSEDPNLGDPDLTDLDLTDPDLGDSDPSNSDPSNSDPSNSDLASSDLASSDSSTANTATPNTASSVEETETTDPASPGSLLPRLQDQWATASPQRQLGWLWQMVNLWIALQQHKVNASLLNPDLLRVDGPVLRLLELDLQSDPPVLGQLGELWEHWLPTTHPSLQPFLQKVSTLLKTKEILYPHPLGQLLEQAMVRLNEGRTCELTIATQTDPGPSRQNNEDACFPEGRSVVTGTADGSSLAIVCDGLGGHEGGEVASAMAVQIIQKRLGSIDPSHPTPIALQIIQRAITKANDAISRRNNDEHRQERRRMGTTLVATLTLNPFTYLFHVGDSRAYWITPRNCRQITVDDDLAARHVSLGFGLYRSVLQSPTSGALVQALGMAPSANLMPNLSPFFLDENALLLLCSDGLSDNDLIERLWDTILLPGLEDSSDLGQICQRIVQEANTYNGHDNVTVAIVHAKFQAGEPIDPKVLLELLEPSNLHPQDSLTEPMQGLGFTGPVQEGDITTGFNRQSMAANMPPANVPEPTPPPTVTEQPEPDNPKPVSPLLLLWGLMVVIIVCTVLGAWLFAPFFNLNSDPDPLSNPLASPEPSPLSSPEATSTPAADPPADPETPNASP